MGYSAIKKNPHFLATYEVKWGHYKLKYGTLKYYHTIKFLFPPKYKSDILKQVDLLGSGGRGLLIRPPYIPS